MTQRSGWVRVLGATGLICLVGVAGAAAAYPKFGRSRCLRWGATPDEVEETLPGDALLATPDILSTRAITIDAPASVIWPWLVQLGPGRGGAYTYDWIENLFGLDMHSANAVLPQFQDLALGDVMSLSPKGPHMRVEVLQNEHALVYRSEDGNWVWAFVLLGDSPNTTRLVSRNRIQTPEAGPLGRIINTLVMEPGSLVMERKMLLGIKERVEQSAAHSLL